MERYILTLKMDRKLAQLRSISQKDKSQAYLSLLSEALSQTNPRDVVRDVHTLVQTAITQDHVGLVVGRQVLAELVKSLGEGIVSDSNAKKQIVEDTLTIAQPRLVSFEEQVSPLRVAPGYSLSCTHL